MYVLLCVSRSVFKAPTPRHFEKFLLIFMVNLMPNFYLVWLYFKIVDIKNGNQS